MIDVGYRYESSYCGIIADCYPGCACEIEVLSYYYSVAEFYYRIESRVQIPVSSHYEASRTDIDSFAEGDARAGYGARVNDTVRPDVALEPGLAVAVIPGPTQYPARIAEEGTNFLSDSHGSKVLGLTLEHLDEASGCAVVIPGDAGGILTSEHFHVVVMLREQSVDLPGCESFRRFVESLFMTENVFLGELNVNDLSRASCDYGIWGHRLCYHAAGGYYGTPAYMALHQQGTSRRYPAVFLDGDGRLLVAGVGCGLEIERYAGNGHMCAGHDDAPGRDDGEFLDHQFAPCRDEMNVVLNRHIIVKEHISGDDDALVADYSALPDSSERTSGISGNGEQFAPDAPECRLEVLHHLIQMPRAVPSRSLVVCLLKITP